MSVLGRLILAITDVCCDIWYTFRPPADSWAMLGVGYRDRTLLPVDMTPDDLAKPCPIPFCGRPSFVGCRTRTGRPAKTHKARQR